MTSFPLIEIEGPPLERGQQYGRQAANVVTKSIELYTKFLSDEGVKWGEICDETRRFTPMLEAYNPQYLEEMCGIAQGAAVDLESIMLVNARTEILYGRKKPVITTNLDDGCTTVAVMGGATRDGHVLQGQNWDWKTGCLETTIILHVKQDNAPDFFTLVEAGGLARHGINSRGICVGANALRSDKDFGRNGIPLGLIRRRILESKLYNEALAAAIQPTRAVSNNMMIGIADGEAVCLETTPEDVFCVWPEDGLLVHSNHFLCPVARSKYKDLNVMVSPNTLYRNRRVEAVLRPRLGDITTDDIKTALFDDFGHPHAVCRPPVVNGLGQTESMTIAMLVYDLTDRTMEVCVAPHKNKEFTKYSFD